MIPETIPIHQQKVGISTGNFCTFVHRLKRGFQNIQLINLSRTTLLYRPECRFCPDPSASSSLSLLPTILLSLILSSNREPGYRITPAATTGPHRHPLPTSSSPITRL